MWPLLSPDTLSKMAEGHWNETTLIMFWLMVNFMVGVNMCVLFLSNYWCFIVFAFKLQCFNSQLPVNILLDQPAQLRHLNTGERGWRTPDTCSCNRKAAPNMSSVKVQCVNFFFHSCYKIIEIFICEMLKCRVTVLQIVLVSEKLQLHRIHI